MLVPFTDAEYRTLVWRSERERVVMVSSSPSGLFPPGTWEPLGFTASTGAATYSITVPTRADSTSSSVADETFVVTTHSTLPGAFVVSEPGTGHSVDNLAPAAPTAFAAIPSGGVSI